MNTGTGTMDDREDVRRVRRCDRSDMIRFCLFSVELVCILFQKESPRNFSGTDRQRWENTVYVCWMDYVLVMFNLTLNTWVVLVVVFRASLSTVDGLPFGWGSATCSAEHPFFVSLLLPPAKHAIVQVLWNTTISTEHKHLNSTTQLDQQYGSITASKTSMVSKLCFNLCVPGSCLQMEGMRFGHVALLVVKKAALDCNAIHLHHVQCRSLPSIKTKECTRTWKDDKVETELITYIFSYPLNAIWNCNSNFFDRKTATAIITAGTTFHLVFQVDYGDHDHVFTGIQKWYRRTIDDVLLGNIKDDIVKGNGARTSSNVELNNSRGNSNGEANRWYVWLDLN